MRSIDVSTDVFARIWALRDIGEDSEDAILRRVLRVDESDPAQFPSTDGIFDKRYQVSFPVGFEIFRTFRGVDRRARVRAGYWSLSGTDERFSSLNELSKAIGAGPENAWMNWWYLTEAGERRQISTLRKPETIARRMVTSVAEATGRDLSAEGGSEMRDVTWLQDVLSVMQQLKKATLAVIYQEVERYRETNGRSLPTSLDAVVRRTLEENSSDSDSYKGRADLFCMPNGKGAGIWALR